MKCFQTFKLFFTYQLGTEALERDTSTDHGIASAMPEQPTNIAATCAPESSSGSLHDLPSERRNLVVCLLCSQDVSLFLLGFCLSLILWFFNQGQSEKELGEDLGHPALAKDISCTTGQTSAPSGESTSNGEDATGDAKETKKATPEVATATPLGLGLGGLDRKVMNELIISGKLLLLVFYCIAYPQVCGFKYLQS